MKENLHSPPPRIDGHAHVFVHQLPMTQSRRYTPSRDAIAATYRTLLTAAGFSGGLLVQPSFLGTDNRYLTQALQNKQDGPQFWGICVLSPTASRRQIVSLAQSGVIGTRLNLIGRRTPDLTTTRWRRFLSLIDEIGWHLEICAEGNRLAEILPPALACCRRVVIDHFGLPEPSAPLQCPGWRAILSAVSRQLWVKTSAPYRVFPGVPPDVAAARCAQLVHVLREHLGQHRIIWGSDWPWTQHESGITYAHTLRWRTQWFEFHEDGAMDLLTAGNGNVSVTTCEK